MSSATRRPLDRLSDAAHATELPEEFRNEHVYEKDERRVRRAGLRNLRALARFCRREHHARAQSRSGCARAQSRPTIPPHPHLRPDDAVDPVLARAFAVAADRSRSYGGRVNRDHPALVVLRLIPASVPVEVRRRVVGRMIDADLPPAPVRSEEELLELARQLVSRCFGEPARHTQQQCPRPGPTALRMATTSVLVAHGPPACSPTLPTVGALA